jgi:hypothetical protein
MGKHLISWFKRLKFLLNTSCSKFYDWLMLFIIFRNYHLEQKSFLLFNFRTAATIVFTDTCHHLASIYLYTNNLFVPLNTLSLKGRIPFFTPKSDRSFDMHGNVLNLYYKILKSIRVNYSLVEERCIYLLFQ